MPLVSDSHYRSPRYLGQADVQTLLPYIFRRVKAVTTQRIRHELTDGDFLDIDFIERGHRRALILTHGMEGDSFKHYIQGMGRLFLDQGWDIIAWNFRSCGGELNRLLPSYHCGSSDDLATVVDFARTKKGYENLALVGFSLGGNVTLKYLGEVGSTIPEISAAATFSVPCCLGSAAKEMRRRRNRLYSNNFLRTMKAKAIAKHRHYPSVIAPAIIRKANHINDFDDIVTAPIHGFKDAEDYYKQCSSKHFLADIQVPALIVNAKNDPFLHGDCYPEAVAKDHPHVYLETPETGGHLGFLQKNYGGTLWSEQRALEFIHAHQQE